MKILHTADWHINLSQKKIPIEWNLNRYELFFHKLKELEKDFDLHIITGDIFDKLPKLNDLQLFFRFISQVEKPTLLTTGNHESEKRTNSFFRFLKEPIEKMNPLVKVVLEVEEHYNFYIVPYEYIKKKETWESLDAMPVFTHVRGAIEPHVKPEIPLEWLEKFPVVFAGDLHSHQNTQRNIVYPGSPMTTTRHRNITTDANGFILIDSETWEWKWKPFDLPQLLRKTVSDESEMIPTEPHHTIYELEGSMTELSGVKDNELLDKKIVKRTSDVELILTEKMSIKDELSEYLTYILNLNNIEEVMSVYHEYN